MDVKNELISKQDVYESPSQVTTKLKIPGKYAVEFVYVKTTEQGSERWKEGMIQSGFAIIESLNLRLSHIET